MFINPQIAIKEGWISHKELSSNPDDWKERNMLCPNALDFTLDHLYSIDSTNIFHISENMKEMRGGKKLETQHDPRYREDFWRLDRDVYDGMSDVYVNLPEGIAAMTIVRSTFNRNGIFITSGLYDSGYQGHIGFAIQNRGGLAFIAPKTRIGQVIFVASDSAGMYSGGYNHKEGTHHSEGKE